VPVPEPEAEEFHVVDTIPAGEWSGKEVVIAVKVKGANGKDAGWSNFAIVPVVPAPEQPRGVRGEAVAGGVRLTWQAAGNNFRVYRSIGGAPFAVVGRPEKPDWTDTTAENGKPYDYLVQTVVKLGQNREAESEPSAAVQVTPVDKFPPAVPAGLQAAASPVSVELAWEPPGDDDFAGYRIYRAPPAGDFALLAESAVPSYSDRSVERGKTYRYAVSAFDKSGNESARSAEVEATPVQ
jgi:fibronectin type 3 domain-containing protein